MPTSGGMFEEISLKQLPQEVFGTHHERLKSKNGASASFSMVTAWRMAIYKCGQRQTLNHLLSYAPIRSRMRMPHQCLYFVLFILTPRPTRRRVRSLL